MNKMKYLIGLIFILASITAFSQIEYKENFWGGKFYQNGEKLKFKNVESIIKQSPDAHQEFLKGKTNSTLSLISSLGGLTLELFALTEILDEGNEANPLGFQLGGLALIGLSYYFDRQKARQFINASNIFNKDTGTSSILINPSITDNGIGLTINF